MSCIPYIFDENNMMTCYVKTFYEVIYTCAFLITDLAHGIPWGYLEVTCQCKQMLSQRTEGIYYILLGQKTVCTLNVIHI